MREIKITRNCVAIVDDEDYERINRRSWACNPQGRGYAVRKGSKRKDEPRTVAMHREVLNAPPGTIIDHINGNGLDNRKVNLRYVNTQQNSFNKRKANMICTSKYKGVFKRTNHKKWTARIKFNDRHVELGSAYLTEEDAAAVYNFASRIFFGEYRKENLGIRELRFSEQVRIYRKCKRYIERYGWYVDTETYRYFFNLEASGVAGKVVS